MAKKDSVLQRFQELETALNGAFFERADEVGGLLCALVARQHVLLLGPPGTGKSALANSLCGALDGATFFGWLMTRYSTPEELFGPVALSALKQDRFERVPAGKLPEAHVAFLDEVFKANSAILNALLTIVNERRWHNGGGAVKVPLEMLVGASNELPEGEELGALFDRFLMRFWVEPLKGDGSFVDLLCAPAPRVATMLTLDDLHAAQLEAAALPVSRDLAGQLTAMRRALAGAGLPPASDRRWVAAVSLLRARAWLDGASEVASEHIAVLQHALWNDPAQRAEVAKIVNQFGASELTDARAVLDAIVDLVARLPNDEAERAKALPGVTREGQRAAQRLTRLIQDAKTPATASKLQGVADQLTLTMSPVRDEARKLLGLG